MSDASVVRLRFGEIVLEYRPDTFYSAVEIAIESQVNPAAITLDRNQFEELRAAMPSFGAAVDQSRELHHAHAAQMGEGGS